MHDATGGGSPSSLQTSGGTPNTELVGRAQVEARCHELPRDDECPTASPHSPPLDFVVTLIHGTRAEAGTWTHRSKSGLCKHLDTEFEGRHFHVNRFPWVAPNRHTARAEGSRRLLEEYYKTDGLFARKDVPHFVIGHSHGGSILAYAMRDDPAIVSGIAGAAFLSTPFIQARQRLAALLVLRMIPCVAAVLAFCALFSGMLIVSPELGFFGSPIVEGFVVSLIGAGLAYAATFKAIGLPKTCLPNKLEDLVKQAVSDVDLTKLQATGLAEKTLILRTNGDEASSGLAAAHIVSRFLGEIPARVVDLPRFSRQWIAREWRHEIDPVDYARATRLRKIVAAVLPPLQKIVAAVLPPLRKIVFIVLALSVLILFSVKLWAWWTQREFEREWPILSGIEKAWLLPLSWSLNGLTWVLLGFVGIAVISVVLAVMASLIVAVLSRLAYGRWLLLTALFMELTVETTPPGQWAITQLSLQDETPQDRSMWFTLAHSMSYDDPRAHRAIAEWIRKRLRGQSDRASGLTADE